MVVNRGALWPLRHTGRQGGRSVSGSIVADPQAGPGMLNEGENCPAGNGSGAPGDL